MGAIGKRRLRVLVVVAVLSAGLPDGTTGLAAEDHEDLTVGPLISGTSSYVDGTYAWTDYAYDDKGPNADGSPGGDAVYPSSIPRGNAADLVQLQLSREPSGLGIRAVLETLTEPDVPLLGLGFDTDDDPATGASTVPGGAWTTSVGLDAFVTVSSDGGSVLTWDGATWNRTAAFPATVDPASNTMTTVAPLHPGGATWRAVGVLGLALPDGSWLDGTGPVYDLAFVEAEPPCTLPGPEPADCIESPDDHWQDARQGDLLVGALPATDAVGRIDFRKMARRETDLATVDERGYHTLLYRSDLDLGEGIGSIEGESSFHAGPYQPYLVRVPSTERPLPVITYLHGGGGNHLQGAVYNFADFDPPALLVFPLGRGPGLGYGGTSALGNVRPTNGYGEQDVLDVLADVSERFEIDADRMIITGISNGGIGSLHFAEFYPDRFTGVVPIVAGDYGIVTINHFRPGLLENLINLRLRMANGAIDPLAHVVASEDTVIALDRLGDVDYRAFLALRRHHSGGVPPDHTEWHRGLIDCVYLDLLEAPRAVDPPRVVYTVNPAFEVEFPETGLRVRHTGAHWVSGLELRDPEARNQTVGGFEVEHDANAKIDITTLTRSVRSVEGTPIVGAEENITEGADYCGPNPEVRTNDAWRIRGMELEPGPEESTINGMTLELTNFSRAALDLPRMGIEVTEPIIVRITGDGDATLDLIGPWEADTAVDVVRDGQHLGALFADEGVLRVGDDFSGSHEYVLTPASSGA